VAGFRILLIADTARAAAGVVEWALRALPPGSAAVQLRDREASGRTLWAAADRLAAVMRRVDARLSINDRADVALAVGADGVHLGRGSASVAECRAQGIATVGVSTHSIDEVRQAATDGADYVVFGPVFETPGKGPPLGLAALERASAVGVPVFALGGVDEGNAAACVRAGAAGVACIRAVLDVADPGSAARRLIDVVSA
jgi:thiamine-phosphate pyrophosphorylase